MKAFILFTNLVIFIVEVMNPGTRFIRAGAVAVKPRSLFYHSVRGMKINPKMKQKTCAQMMAETNEKRESPESDDAERKYTSHKAGPLEFVSIPLLMESVTAPPETFMLPASAFGPPISHPPISVA